MKRIEIPTKIRLAERLVHVRYVVYDMGVCVCVSAVHLHTSYSEHSLTGCKRAYDLSHLREILFTRLMLKMHEI